MKKAIALIFATLTLLSCGGGGGTGSVPGGNGGGNADTHFVAVKSLNADKNAVSLGESISISWNVSFSSASGLYTAEFYISSTPDVPPFRANYNIYTANCGSGSIYTCGSKGQVNCTYTNKLSGSPVFTRNSTSRAVPFTGNGYLVLCPTSGKLRSVPRGDFAPTMVNLPATFGGL